MTPSLRSSRFLFTLFLLWISTPGNAASVISVDPKGLVVVDLAGDTSFRQGALVCFFNAQQKPVACGLIQSITESSTQILVRSDFVSRVTPGMIAKLAPAKLQPGAKAAAAVPQKASPPATLENPKTVLPKVAETPSQEVPPSPSSWSLNAGGLFIPVHLVKFQAVSYSAPINRDTTPVSLGTVDTLWKSEREVNKNFSSAYGLELAYRRDWEYRFGLRTVLLGNYNFQDNYDLVRQSNNSDKLRYYADTAMSGQDYGLTFDVYPLRLSGGMWSWSLGTGLDLNQSRVLMEMKKVDDELKEEIVLAQYTSTMRTLSLRLVSSLKLQLGAFDLGFGLYLLAPSLSFIDLVTTVGDPQMTKNLESKDGKGDLEQAISHDMSKFAVQTFWSLGYHF